MKKFASLLLALCMLFTCAQALATTYEGFTEEQFAALDKTTVVKSADSPTGYFVTFRYKDPEATRVRIYGEWAFSAMDQASFVTSENATPDQWQDGDTVWTTGDWPTADMVKDEATGIWSYTIPLPTGTWNYRFYVGGKAGAEPTDYTDAVMVADPANAHYIIDPNAELNGEECLTSVYVPYDEVKQAKTVARPEEAPRASENGKVLFESAKTSGGIDTSYGVYLPYGYDANRAEKYPILVLFHGGGGYDGSWFNNGLVNILDNMIADGRMEPTIVVTPNGSDFPNDTFMWDRPAILDFAVNTILPHMSKDYNAAEDPAHRAFAGLSMGGATTGYALFHYTDAFDYFFLFSAPFLGDIQPDYTLPQLKDKHIFIGYGDYDFVVTRSIFRLEPDKEGDNAGQRSLLIGGWGSNEGSTLEYLIGLTNAGVPVKIDHLPYGHQWALWRQFAVYTFGNMLWK